MSARVSADAFDESAACSDSALAEICLSVLLLLAAVAAVAPPDSSVFGAHGKLEPARSAYVSWNASIRQLEPARSAYVSWNVSIRQLERQHTSVGTC